MEKLPYFTEPILQNQFAGSEDDWRQAATRLLRGAPWHKLETSTLEGTTQDPLYWESVASPSQSASHRRSWKIVQYLEPDAPDFAIDIQEDLSGGAEAFWIPLFRDQRWLGLSDEQLSALQHAPVVLLDGGPVAYDIASSRRATAQGTTIVIGDPCASLLQRGTAELDWKASVQAMAAGIEAFGLAVDARPVGSATGSAVHELGYLLAATRQMWTALRDTVAVDVLASRTHWIIPVGRDSFAALAKLRAARRMYAALAQSFGVADEAGNQLTIVATVAPASLTANDPWVNLIRNTVEGFAAITGGADFVALGLADAALGTRSELARRMARNTQLILREESHLDHVVDPAAGSYTLEALTHQWQTEAAGIADAWPDMFGAILSGQWQAALQPIVEERSKRLRRRTRPITGVSTFAWLDERPLEGKPLAAAATSPQPANSGTAIHATPLDVARESSGFETLRAAIEAKGSPTIFAANLGTIPQHKARSTFALNVFGAGGIRQTENNGFGSPEEVVAAFKDSGCADAVICGQDGQYLEWLPSLIMSLREAGARCLFVAGNPAKVVDSSKEGKPAVDCSANWHAAGLTAAVYLGCDVYGVLADYATTLGVALTGGES